MLSSQRLLSRALFAVLQCRGLSNDAAASLAAMSAHCGFHPHKHQSGQPLVQQQHQQQCSTLQQLWNSSSSSSSSSNSLLGTSRNSSATQGLQGQTPIDLSSISVILQQLDRSLQQCLQLSNTQFQQHAAQQHTHQQQQGTHSLQPQLLDLPAAVQSPPSGDAAGPHPLLCIKRTYQPHPKRYKRKHGFLKR
jgi:hypothetical protein